MKKVVMLTVILSVFFSLQAFAANRDNAVTMSFSGGGYTFDSREEINLATIGKVTLGYDISKYFGLEIPFLLGASDVKRDKLYGYDYNKVEISKDTDVNLQGYRLEGLIYLMPDSWFVPYIALGVGNRNVDVKGADEKNNFVANYGAGARIFVSENIFIRTDFRHAIVFRAFDGNPVNNLEYTLGLGWLMAPKPKPAPVAAVAPVIVEPPKPAPVIETPPPAPVVVPTVIEKEILEKGRTTIDVKFKFDKSDIDTEYDSELVIFANVLKKYPDLNVTIEGHTDSIGTAKYNKALSQRRADSVKKYLVNKLGIDASRLKTVGYGLEKPVADNKTVQGRKLNRRVEAAVDYWTVKKVVQ